MVASCAQAAECPTARYTSGLNISIDQRKKHMFREMSFMVVQQRLSASNSEKSFILLHGICKLCHHPLARVVAGFIKLFGYNWR